MAHVNIWCTLPEMHNFDKHPTDFGQIWHSNKIPPPPFRYALNRVQVYLYPLKHPELDSSLNFWFFVSDVRLREFLEALEKYITKKENARDSSRHQLTSRADNSLEQVNKKSLSRGSFSPDTIGSISPKNSKMGISWFFA